MRIFRTRGARRCAATLTRACLSETLEPRTLLAFGLTATASTFTVDTGAGVTFSVLRAGTSSTVHSGDLTSFKLNGVEFEAPYSSTARYSHFESGLSNSSVISASADPAGNWIKISCDDTTATVGAGATGVIMYYMARKNDPVIYMATYAPEMLVSSTRFITYLDWNKFPNHPNASDTSAIGGTAQTAIESSDVYAEPATGYSHSKYYGETQNIDHVYHSATGPAAGAYMFIGNRERGTSGPFFKDIDFQSTGASIELYNMPFSGHSNTDNYPSNTPTDFRPGLHGPFALVLTNGVAAPTTPNYSFIDGVGLTGWVSASARGSLTGKATGITAGHIPTVAITNAAAQYWATPDASGNYSIANVIPGTYTETYYDEELAVGTRSVTITAGQTTHADIVNTYYLPSAIFRIGTFDGTPREFMNGDKITIMHPSDTRMTPWTDLTTANPFVVGTSATNTLPMAEWKRDATQTGTTANITLSFTLTAAQAAAANTLRIGITRAEAGGRPIISVNGGSYSGAAAASTQPDTRGITLGNWRGNNWMYTYGIGANVMHSGTNTISMVVASGSSSGSAWLQPSYMFDAIDLVPTTNLTNAPHVASVTISPTSPTNIVTTQRTFTAAAKDQFGNAIAANFSWSATRGVLDGSGLYTAPGTAGNDPVSVIASSIIVNAIGSAVNTNTATTSTTVNVVNDVPTVATAAGATPNPVTGKTTQFSALGADTLVGEAGLTYTWATTGSPPASVTFSANGTNAAKSSLATFSKAGTYSLQVTIANPSGFSVTSTVSVVVNQTLTSISVTPGTVNVGQGATQQFAASAIDQFGNAMTSQPSLTWNASQGTVSPAGLFIAPATIGPVTVTAKNGSITGTANVTVVDTTAPTATGGFEFETDQSVTIGFSEDVLASVSLNDLVITRASDNSVVPASELALTLSGAAGTPTTAKWTHTGSLLADGDYHATLPSGSVKDPSNNPLASDLTVDFFVMAGDANRDRTVNFTDLLAVAQNYGNAGTFSQGDFNYDGQVNFSDVLTLAQVYGSSLSSAVFSAAPITASNAKADRRDEESILQ